MTRLEYTVRFTTPAFLGNAEQSGQWRTPPFKALLRQWWRIVQALTCGYEVEKLRNEEGLLFGAATEGGDARRSLVRIRLSDWALGGVDGWQRDDRVSHPEVTNRQGQSLQVGAQLYLGYGPLTFGDTGRRNPQGNPIKDTVLNPNPKRTAIDDGSERTLSVLVPPDSGSQVERTVHLVEWFGTLGSRSRNGWGGVQLEPKLETSTPALPALERNALRGLLRPLEGCLQLDWPHAIGEDGRGPLVWQTQPMHSWREVMKELARIKIAFRTQQDLSMEGVGAGRFAARHFLGYPLTHHPVTGPGWGSQGRLANQLRFKVRKVGDQWRGVLVHLPCRLPAEMARGLPAADRAGIDAKARETWQAVHAVIDQHAERI